MNVTTNYTHVSLVTTNPATESVARDNAIKSVIPAVISPVSIKPEPAVAKEKEKTQSNSQVAVSQYPTYDHLQEYKVKEIEDPTEQEHRDQQSHHHGDNFDEIYERIKRHDELKIDELKQLEQSVMSHERAHVNAGGQYTKTPQYTYQTGPDGVKYVVAGEVSIDTAKVANDPQATIIKAKQIKFAALAPENPSAQDRHVVVIADRLINNARQELMEQLSDSEDNKNTYRIEDAIESETFKERAVLAKNQDFITTIANRSQYINAYYQGSSQVSNKSSLHQEI